MEEIKVNKADEIVYHEKLDNGLDVYIYPKKGFACKFAKYVTKYGSCYNEFIPIGRKKMTEFPKGIAHFLEHKLFESNDDEGIFSKFESYGAYVNAYTSHTETCYHFTTTENFYECLNLLLDFVQNPYFTDSNVEKEKGIIEQEINMSNDNIARYMLEKMYENTLINNPNKYKTIGSKESVRRITKEDLYECYNTFYNPSNMILVVAGDVDVTETLNEIKKNQDKRKTKYESEIVLKEYNEEEKVSKEYEWVRKNVAIPKILISYKFVFDKKKGYDLFRRNMMFSYLLDLKFGSTTNFREYLIDNNIINSSFSYDYTSFDDVVILYFTCDVNDKDKLIEVIDKKLRDDDFDEERFKLITKCNLSYVINTYEDLEYVASKIYGNIILYGEFLDNTYEEYKNYKFSNFVNDVKELNYDNKAIIYITSNSEE